MRHAILAAVLFALVGCGSRAEQRSEPINATVTVLQPNGQPLANVLCKFIPASGAQLAGEYPLGADGKPMPPKPGPIMLSPGKYTVRFEPLDSPEKRAVYQAAFKNVPKQYTEVDKSALEFEVESGKTEYTLKLTN